jgi:hypothetical protein
VSKETKKKLIFNNYFVIPACGSRAFETRRTSQQ